LSDYLLAVLLGIVEGVTEFLPVSSTAHLRIFEALLHIGMRNPYWKMFSIVIQLGAILCLPIYFRDRIKELVRDFPRGKRGDRTVLTHPLTLVILAFVVTAIPAFLLTKIIGKNLERLHIMAYALIIGGVIMWAVDTIYEHSEVFTRGELTENMDDMSVLQAVWIGFCQIFSAVFPGTSRSMSTITGGELASMSRKAALEFSFFLSMPTMLVATLYDLLKAALPHHGETSVMGSMPNDFSHWMTLLTGFVVSFVVAYGVVAWFMRWVRTQGFTVFAIYRILVGVAVLWWFR
jgi:undecaprenyl-diphosphatase